MIQRWRELLPRWLRRRLLLKFLRFDEDRLRDVRVRLADHEIKTHESLQLLHRIYVSSAITQPHASGLYLNKHLANPRTLTFCAMQGDVVVGTTSLVLDSALGLPGDASHRDVNDGLRTQGRRLAECVATACDARFRHTGLVFLLYQAMIRVAKSAGIDLVVIRARPKGVLLYEELMVADRLGGPRVDPSARTPAGVPISFTLLGVSPRLAEGRVRERFRSYAGKRITPVELFFEPHPQVHLPAELLVTEERRAVCRSLLAVRQDILDKASADERGFLLDAVASCATASPLVSRPAALAEASGHGA